MKVLDKQFEHCKAMDKWLKEKVKSIRNSWNHQIKEIESMWNCQIDKILLIALSNTVRFLFLLYKNLKQRLRADVLV